MRNNTATQVDCLVTLTTSVYNIRINTGIAPSREIDCDTINGIILLTNLQTENILAANPNYGLGAY